MQFSTELPITAFQSKSSFSPYEEGESDKCLASCFVLTNSIRDFIRNIEAKSIVVAPVGAGKSGLGQMVTDDQSKLLPNSKQYLKCASIGSIPGINAEKMSINSVKEIILDYLFETIKNHLEGMYPPSVLAGLNREKQIMQINKITKGGTVSKDPSLSATEEASAKYTPVSLEQLYHFLAAFLSEKGKVVLICFDCLDYITLNLSNENKSKVVTAFYQSIDFIKRHGGHYCPILPIMFIRSDLYRFLDTRGIGNKNLKVQQLYWSDTEILRFILKRLIRNPAISDAIRYTHKNYQFDFGLFRRRKRLEEIIDLYDDTECKLLFYSFFPKTVSVCEKGKQKRIPFFNWLYDTLKDANGVITPRVVINFFNNYLFLCYEYFNSKGITYVPKDTTSNSFKIGNTQIALNALHQIQEDIIKGYANHVAIHTKQAQTPDPIIERYKKAIKYIAQSAKDGIVYPQNIDYSRLQFDKSEYDMMINELEFWGFFSQVENSLPYTEYTLSPLMASLSH